MSAKQNNQEAKPRGERQEEIDRLEREVEELRSLASDETADAEVERIRQQVAELRREFYTHLGPWQRAQIARHQQRPYTLDYIGLLFTDFVELHGDRAFGDDKALIAGLAKYHGRPVAVIGHQKGPRYEATLGAQFWPAEAGGLSQGAARDATGGEIWTAHHYVD